METEQKHKLSSWMTVVVIVVATVLLAFAFVAQSVPLGIVGAVVAFIGLVMGVAGGIMDDAH